MNLFIASALQHTHDDESSSPDPRTTPPGDKLEDADTDLQSPAGMRRGRRPGPHAHPTPPPEFLRGRAEESARPCLPRDTWL